MSKNNILVICTTHYPELKNYAIKEERFENASSEFDIENLIPTYKLLIGVPGQSNAFSICKKLGIKEDIISYAKSLMDSDTIHIEDIIKSIYDDKLKIEQDKTIIENEKNSIVELRKSLERDNSQLLEQEREIISKAKIEARDILLNAKEEADLIIRNLNNMASSKDANILRNKLNEDIKSLDVTSSLDVPSNELLKLNKEDISLNMTVFIPSIKQYGLVISLPDKDNKLKLQIGNTKMFYNIDKLEKTNKNIKNDNSHYTVNLNSSSTAKNISNEINVIGLNVEDAIQIVDKFIDSMSMANIKTCRIVHGKGTGKLRKGIHEYLKTNNRVKDFRIGTYGEGEMGVTVVEVK